MFIKGSPGILRNLKQGCLNSYQLLLRFSNEAQSVLDVGQRISQLSKSRKHSGTSHDNQQVTQLLQDGSRPLSRSRRSVELSVYSPEAPSLNLYDNAFCSH
jgi:hypothetical protein